MTRILAIVLKSSRVLQWIAGASLVFLMVLTICDVLLRTMFSAIPHAAGFDFLRSWIKPIPGTYELVGFAGGIAIGLAMPFTSWVRGHVFVDTFLTPLPKRVQMGIHITTRLMSAGLFLLLGWNLIRFGLDLRASGEVSLTLQLPFYPIAFGLALASFVQVVVLLCDIVISLRGGHE